MACVAVLGDGDQALRLEQEHFRLEAYLLVIDNEVYPVIDVIQQGRGFAYRCFKVMLCPVWTLNKV